MDFAEQLSTGFRGVAYSREAALNEWWKQFRYLKKEEAIRTIDMVRSRAHGMREYMNGYHIWYNNILPILHTRSLWNSASFTVKEQVHQAIMDAQFELIHGKLAKVVTLKSIGFKSFADLDEQNRKLKKK